MRGRTRRRRGARPMTTATTQYSFTEKKRIRKDFGKSRSILEVPFLLAIQVDSYREFLQERAEPGKREDRGLHAALKSVFPTTTPPWKPPPGPSSPWVIT